jgi:dienelactone hydrolase
MRTETLEYKDGDLTLKGFLARDDQSDQKRPGILVIPEAFGLGAHAKERAQRLAALGFVALAADPYGNGLEVDNLEEAVKQMTAIRETPEKFRQRVRVALDTLSALPQVDSDRLATIGFCMGGMLSLELARDGAPLRGIVSFHGALETDKPAEAGQVKAKVLVCHGNDDPIVPPAQVQAFQEEMTKAGANWQVISYGNTVHSFTNPDAANAGMDGIAYNQQADERSWKSMRDFFAEIF